MFTCCLDRIPLSTNARDKIMDYSRWVRSPGWCTRYKIFDGMFSLIFFKLESSYFVQYFLSRACPRCFSVKNASERDELNSMTNIRIIKVTVIFPVYNRIFYDCTFYNRSPRLGILSQEQSRYEPSIASAMNSNLTGIHKWKCFN